MPAPALALVALALVPRVVVARDGARTILSIQSDLATPWPLPAGVKREDAVSIPAAAFDAIDAIDAPLLEDRWHADPCPAPEIVDDSEPYHGRTPPEQGSAVHYVETPAPPPGSHADVGTTTPGFRVETTGPTLAVPVLAGQEVVILVLASTPYEPVDVPLLALPRMIEVPERLRGSFPELYQAVFEHASRTRPGVVVREGVGQTDPRTDALRNFGYADVQTASLTRLHTRPGASANQIVLAPGRAASQDSPSFVVVHPWVAPIRCVDPDLDTLSTVPPVSVAIAAEPLRPTSADLLRLELPELGLHARTWWSGRSPLEGGSVAGGGLGLCVALVVRRRARR